MMPDPKTALFAIGRPFSPLYSAIMRLRAILYTKGIFKQHALKIPVISIGNLTLGGTGKTPMVQYLARDLQKRGWNPAIISRGYGGTAQEGVNIVSDHNQVYLDAKSAGDEPRLLAVNLPGIPVLTGVVRSLPARHAIQLGADILILDDGFQHLSIKRDLDLVLFNGDSLAGNSRVFPGGDLREPVKALGRCHAFILTSIDKGNQDRANKFSNLLHSRFPQQPLFLSSYAPVKLIRRNQDLSETTINCDDTAGLPLFGFCGIAHPAAFKNTLSRLPLQLRGFSNFKDHHAYQELDITKICKLAKKQDAQGLITTEKDCVKLKNIRCDLPLFYPEMKVTMTDNSFDQFVSNFLLQL